MGRPRTIVFHALKSKYNKTQILFVTRDSDSCISHYGYVYTEEHLLELPSLRTVSQQLRKVLDIPKKTILEIVSVSDLTFNSKTNKLL